MGLSDAELYARAVSVIPGGVNSPVRAFNGVGGDPLFVVSGKGPYVTAADGRVFQDYCCSWGAMILGHAHPEVTQAIQARATLGTTFGIATQDEVFFAERLASCVPGMEKVRVVNSGTEAVMTAIRLARGFTKRSRVVKFDGCYHGHSDAMLVKSGSGVLTMGASSSAGVPSGAVVDTAVLPYNDSVALADFFKAHGTDVAAVIVEPVAGNMGLVPGNLAFLHHLESLVRQSGGLLICDEVIDGFRFALSSWSHAFGNLHPDIITLGKVIGGGLPLAAVGGRAEIMDCLAPAGPVYQAGTLAGNPLAVASGLKTLDVLARDNPYPRLANLAHEIATGVAACAKECSVPVQCAQYQGVFTLFCRESARGPVVDLSAAKESDLALYARIFHGLYARGIYIAPSQFEINFVSAAHTHEHAVQFLDAFEQTLKKL